MQDLCYKVFWGSPVRGPNQLWAHECGDSSAFENLIDRYNQC